jgi:hypothetical protein
MRFRDLFPPKWRCGDWTVRKAAVEKLIDQTLLGRIAKTDGNATVREAAARKLTNLTSHESTRTNPEVGGRINEPANNI